MEEQYTDIWNDYQDSLEYDKAMHLDAIYKECVDFVEGRQWAKPTKATKSLPRPVMNFLEQICNNKKSSILATPVRFVFSAEDDSIKMEKYNKFVEYLCKEMNLEKFNNKAMDDGTIKGSYFYHLYWDSEARGKDGVQEGALRVEVIDPSNVFYANPSEEDGQKQKWVMIRTLEEVDTVRAKCDSKYNAKEIVADDEEVNDSPYNEKRSKTSHLVTVLTRYFRKNGEVYWERGTKTTMVNEGRALAPDLIEASKMLKMDAPNNSSPDDKQDENLIPYTAKATMFPVIRGVYKRRQGCIKGRGEVEGLIPNQKIINFAKAMEILNIQETAWSKWVVLPNALQGQQITNTPGEVLEDRTGTGRGINRIVGQTFNGEVMNLVNDLLSTTKNLAGSSEVMTGEVVRSNMSGAAIAQMQATANQPIKNLRDEFWITLKELAEVICQFTRTHYTNVSFFYDEEEKVEDENGLITTKVTRKEDVFNSSEYQNSRIDVVVEATAGTLSTTAGDIAILEMLYNKGELTGIDLVKSYPDNAISNKQKLIEALENREQSAQERVAQLTAELEQAHEMIKNQVDIINKATSVINEGKKLKEDYIELYQEATAKITQGNEEIEKGNLALTEATNDARDFAIAYMNKN